MTTFALEKRHNQFDTFDCPQWADVLARFWLFMMAVTTLALPRVEVWIITRYDLLRRRVGPFPPAGWQVAAMFVVIAVTFLWQDFVIGLLSKGLGGVCLA